MDFILTVGALIVYAIVVAGIISAFMEHDDDE